MKRKVITKLASLVLTLVILSFLVFALLYIAPGDPAEKRLTSQGIAVTKEVLDAERERLGLLRPFLVRYGEWLWHILRGDFGISFKDDLPVAPKLAKGLKNTGILALTSLAVSLTGSVLLGAWSAFRQNSAADYVIRLLSFIGNSLPNFLISVLLMYFLCIRMQLFPVIASGSLQGLFMPVLSLSVPMMGRLTRQMRAEFIRELEEDYITAMRGRNVRTRFLVRNVMHNTAGHLFTIVALQIGTLMGGSVVIETIFRWPGIGKLVMDSINARDYPVIMGFVMIMGTIYFVLNQLSDMLLPALDPRTNSDI